MEAERCKERVFPNERWGVFHPHQCSRRAVKDGFCKIHHPDEKKAREEKAHAAWREKQERESPSSAERRGRLSALREVREMVIRSRAWGQLDAVKTIDSMIAKEEKL